MIIVVWCLRVSRVIRMRTYAIYSYNAELISQERVRIGVNNILDYILWCVFVF